MLASEQAELDEIVKWFMSKDFGILLEEQVVGRVWAHLTRPPGGKIVALKYGVGSTPISAARRAKQRFEQEQ